MQKRVRKYIWFKNSGFRFSKRACVRESTRKVKVEGGLSGAEFNHLILSCSLDDILNDDLHKDKVKKIPLKFESHQHYLGSFVEQLLENIRSKLASSMEIMHIAPRAEVLSLSNTYGCGMLVLRLLLVTRKTNRRDVAKILTRHYLKMRKV
ncbi:hypothetical protein R6Q59_035241 [Mikania micrantha]